MCTGIYVCICECPWGEGIPLKLELEAVGSCLMWVLEVELGSSAWAIHVLNHQAISSNSFVFCFFFLKVEGGQWRIVTTLCLLRDWTFILGVEWAVQRFGCGWLCGFLVLFGSFGSSHLECNNYTMSPTFGTESNCPGHRGYSSEGAPSQGEISSLSSFRKSFKFFIYFYFIYMGTSPACVSR